MRHKSFERKDLEGKKEEGGQGEEVLKEGQRERNWERGSERERKRGKWNERGDWDEGMQESIK